MRIEPYPGKFVLTEDGGHWVRPSGEIVPCEPSVLDISKLVPEGTVIRALPDGYGGALFVADAAAAETTDAVSPSRPVATPGLPTVD